MFYICFLFISIYYYLKIIKSIKYNKAILHCMFFMILLFSLSNIESIVTRNILSIIFLFVISCDFIITVFFENEYGGRFNYSFALSIIETTNKEAKGMIDIYKKYFILFFCFYFFCIFTVNINFYKVSPFFGFVFLFFFFSFFVIKEYIHSIRKSNIENKFVRVLNYFPFSNLNPFLQAFLDKKKISEISRKIPKYNFKVEENGNDIFILLIGESARPDNMSAYGYKRKTTPYLDDEKNKILLNNVYSPASVTATSVPISLSNAKVGDYKISDYSDNVVNVANSIGFKTYWFSNQGKHGDHSNAITGIAMNCDEKEWVSGFDENLLPLLDSALSDQDRRKKFIVLHLYGSHVPCKERYPESSSFYKGECEDDYYDNSIKYTDYLIFEILNRIKERNGSLIYFSDHGLERINDNGDIIYKHGGVNSSKEAFKIPMFIYNPVSVCEMGEFTNKIWLTENNYQLIKKWFGIRDDINISELFFENSVMVMDTTGKIKIIEV